MRTRDSGAVDYEPFPEPSRRGRWVLWLLLAIVVLGLGGAGVALVTYQRQVDPAGPTGDDVSITIPQGTSGQRIAEILEDKGVIESAQAFRIYLRVNGTEGFQAGDYTFRTRMSFAEVVALLRKGPEITFNRITIPEGLTLTQIAERVGKLPGRSAQRFLELARSGTIRSRFQPPGSAQLEGLLFPETYFVEEKDDERAILQRMVTAFDDVATQAGIDRAPETVGLSPYEAIILASLIERETRFDDERGKVSRVIHNRLKRGELLQVDATVIYALGKSADRNVRVLFKDLEVDSPYNTYKVKGLPPGPIAAPGRESLAAAVEPEPGDWLFYVVVETDGRHAFAVTQSEHAANIREAERNGAR